METMNKNMKHIKAFEELHPDVYKKAGTELKNMNHTDRGSNLIKYGLNKKKQDSINNAENIRNVFNKYNMGKLALYIDWFAKNDAGWDFDGDDKNFDWSWITLTDITLEEWDNAADINLIRGFISIIPSKEMIEYVFNEYEEERDDHEGAVEFIQDELFTGSMPVILVNLKVGTELDEKLKLVGIDVSGFGEFENVEFLDRKSANKFKHTLFNIFSKKIEYPSGEHGHWLHKPAYEELDEMFSELDILSEYNTEIEDLAPQIKSYPTNKMYRQH
jgi:hypothetical protein